MRIVILKSRQPFKASIPGQAPRSAWQRRLNNHGWRSDDLYRLAIDLLDNKNTIEIEFDQADQAPAIAEASAPQGGITHE